MPESVLPRLALGFIAGIVSVLVFHQGMVALLHVADLPGFPALLAYSTDPTPFWGLPRLFGLCLWGGAWGALFGWMAPGLFRPPMLAGVCFGIVVTLVWLFVAAPIGGEPVGGGWLPGNWLSSLAINGSFGLALGLIYPLLVPRAFVRA
jgi:hypothetical protein